MNLKKIALPVIAFATFGLVACGESGTTEQITNNTYTTGMEVVAAVADLPKCTADNAGEQYLVKADGEFYACNGKDWKALGGSGATASDYGCETEPLADGSGVNILCNGEVIGTVLNGKDGAAGEQGVAGADGKDGLNGADGKDGEKGDKGEIGAGCKIVAQTESAVTIQCGDDKFSMNLNGGSGESSGGEIITPVEDDEISVEIPELSGVSQKGPFIMGTEVKGYELDGTRAFAQTGRSFTGRIETNDGKFRINSVKLVSSQVLLSATGYYRDEVSGDQSKSPITLYAITDLTDRSNVNVNLLTHLEYDRVAKMMKESDGTLKIKTAKKNAQKEIFAAFGIDATGFGYSEDLDIFGTDDQSAALLAISILLQGDRSEADLSGLLASFSKDIEEDGKWDDKATRGTIAKWAADMDNDKKYGVYRGYVKGWGLGSVPGFEKYLRNFWSREYGLGVCGSDTVPVGTVKNATNNNGEASKDYAASYTSQANKKRFICVDADSLKWRVATDIEKDTMGLKHGAVTTHEQASVINGLVNTDYVYVYEDNQYRRGTDLDKSLGLGGCTKTRVDSVWKSGSAWYTCVDTSSTVLNALGTKTAWRTSTNIEKDTIHWSTLKSNFDGEVSKGQITDNYYIYEKSKGAWRKATQTEYDTYDYKNNKDWIADTVDGAYKLGEISKSQYYVFDRKQGAWRMETTAFDHTHEIDGCTETREGEYIRSAKSDSVYYCSNKAWSKTSELVNDTYGSSCNAGRFGEVVNGFFNTTKIYACNGSAWVFKRDNPQNHKFGVVTDVRDNQVYLTVTIGTQTWMAENLNYDYNEGTAESYCYSNSSANCDKYGRLYLWSAAMDSAAVFSDAGKGCGYGKTCDVASTGSTTVVRGVCPEGWHLPSNSDWSALWTAIGGTSTAGTKLKSASGWNSNGNGADNYGFSVLPAGYRYSDGDFGYVGSYAYFWSSTEVSGNSAYSKYFYGGYEGVDERDSRKYYGFSVRCLKD